ncbi:MAG: DUF3667 domain-containing protein [Chthoniobacterales bacterium]
MSDDSTQLILGDAAIDATTEGKRGRRRKRSRRTDERVLTHCENCGAPLSGPYCSACGQHAIDYHRSLWRVLIDAADSFLNWDTKFLSTIGVLLIRPWQLTNDFNAGRRARYVHPLRLYLLASIAFFLIARMVHVGNHVVLDPKDRAQISATLAQLTGPDSALPQDQQAKIDSIRNRIVQANGSISDQERADLKEIINSAVKEKMKNKMKVEDRAKLKAALAMIPRTPRKPAPPVPPDGSTAASPAAPVAPPDESAVASPAPPEAAPELPEDGPIDIHIDDNDDKAKTPFEKWLQDRVKHKIGEHGTNLKLFLQTLRNNLPPMMLCCIPLFAFVLKMLYIRRRRLYVEHLVYALHIHSFVYVAVVVITLLALGVAQWSNLARILVTVALSIVVFVQVFVSIRRVYAQGWFRSTLKFIVGGIVYFVILILAVGVTAVVTILLPD